MPIAPIAPIVPLALLLALMTLLASSSRLSSRRDGISPNRHLHHNSRIVGQTQRQQKWENKPAFIETPPKADCPQLARSILVLKGRNWVEADKPKPPDNG